MKYKWFFLGVMVFVVLLIKPIIPTQPHISYMLAIIIFMGILWLTEALPIGITALFPLILYPMLNISNANQVSINYFNSTIFLFLGGFILSIAIEKTGLHKRISLSLLKILGQSKDGILLAFTISPWFLSMFISNTAATLIMLPISVSIINNLSSELTSKCRDSFGKALLFAIAYSSSIGGIATLIGTPPNLVFQKIFTINFPELTEISFAKWLAIAFPISLMLLIAEYLILRLIFLRNFPSKVVDPKEFNTTITKDTEFSSMQMITFLVFITTCLLWIFRNTIDLGFLKIPGWSDLLGLNRFVDDSTVSIFAALLLFIFPANFKNPKERILVVQDLRKVPWEIILLFGGGFAIADGFENTGLSDYLAQSLIGYTHFPDFALIVIVSTVIVITTEFSSNTAVASTFLPIIASITKILGMPPIKLMVPATISSSLAFMLPISTPPNAIVFSTGKIKIREMAFIGLILNIVGVLIVSLYFYFLF